MAESWKDQADVTEATWLNLLQQATQGEIDTFLALLDQAGLKIIEVQKYNHLIETVDQAIKEIEALEYRIKTLLEV